MKICKIIAFSNYFREICGEKRILIGFNHILAWQTVIF